MTREPSVAMIAYEDLERHDYLQFVADYKARHGKSRGAEEAWAEHIGRKPNTWAVWKRAHWPDLVVKRNAPTGDEHPERNPADVPTDGDTGPAPTNGNLPAIPAAHSIVSERISALPAHDDASALDKLRGRVAVLEAFMEALQEQQRPSASQRTDSASAHSDALERIHEALARMDARLQAVETSPPPIALPAHSDAPARPSAWERTEPPVWKSQGSNSLRICWRGSTSTPGRPAWKSGPLLIWLCARFGP
jgi:hypothetical protein